MLTWVLEEAFFLNRWWKLICRVKWENVELEFINTIRDLANKYESYTNNQMINAIIEEFDIYSKLTLIGKINESLKIIDSIIVPF